jgi:hypothetical protein
VFGALLSLINPVSTVVKELVSERVALTSATTEQDRIASQERIAVLQARRDVLIAASGSRSNRIMRFLLAVGPMIYLNKIFIWDKALARGSTDPLSADLWYVALMVIGFYFLADAATVLKR